jgi:3-hydroxyisobutyrate dehydrogenase-like beta-hydroxyacid dehydrogenase
VEKGVVLATDAAAAIAASPLVVMCVTNQTAARQILIQNENAFSGKLLVQLTSSITFSTCRERSREFLFEGKPVFAAIESTIGIMLMELSL